MCETRKLTFNSNNGGEITFSQLKHDDNVLVIMDNDCEVITNSEMIMLLNYYIYIKNNDIHCDFINPNGKN